MPEAHYVLARAYLAHGGPQAGLDACQALDRCIELNPEHKAAKTLLSETWKDVLPVADKARQFGTWQATKEAAIQAFREGKLPLALDYYKAAVGPSFETRPTRETQGMLCKIAEIHLSLGGTDDIEEARKAAKNVGWK